MEFGEEDYDLPESGDEEDYDDVASMSDKWGGVDEMGLRTAVFVSFLKLETFKRGLKVLPRASMSSKASSKFMQSINKSVHKPQ